MDTPLVALIVVAGTSLAVAVPCLLLALLCRRHSSRKSQRCCSASAAASTLPVSASAGTTPAGCPSWSFYGTTADASLQKLSLADLAAATGGFSPDNTIGDGSFGFVYRAVLPDGAAVAVKRLSGDATRAPIQILGMIDVCGISNRYVAPEIWDGVGATVKADLYSFVVLVIELVTGLRPSWPMKASKGEKEVDLVDWAREKIGEGQASEILDHRMGIQAQGKEMEEAKGLFEIAPRCIDSAAKNRPTMEEAVAMLNKI
ncbi:unnamed protein product [Miscanthus lutarioriparius]|uniref:Serine-threonine/tyrosine-protein kinase catalytic domain-containing protein n=1 Tax=Miscanthus lutarioriparius TaxID=422564 RepID=A0A811Q7Y5_9POAL|nr:unnamed protein product [Miscanthus lutarioriparius]